MNRSICYALPRAAAASLLPLLLLCPAPAQGMVKTLTAGAVAPDFGALDLDGKEVRLADFRAKVVVLDFWATWCGPCLKALPEMQELAKTRKDAGVVVLAVCTSDTRARFETWMQKNRQEYPDIVFACDPHDRGSDTFDDRVSYRQFGVSLLPTRFVIGRDGKVALTLVGHQDEDRRMSAGLARAGIAVDPAIAAAGEAQIEESARAAAARAAEASARKQPLFFPAFGELKPGTVLPELGLIGADGAPISLSALRGKPVVLSMSWGEGVPRQHLAEIAARYSGYGVEVLSITVSTPREEFDAWVATHGKDQAFRITWDPAGKYQSSGEEADPGEQREFHLGTVIGKVFGGGMYPAMPLMLVVDAKGGFVGGLQFHPRWKDGLANLLLRSGVALKDADMPEVVAPAEAFAPPAPTAAPKEDKVEPITVGTIAPDFTTQDLEGGPVRLADFRGKVVVLDFWATWCGPCKAAMPHVQQIAAEYREQGVVVLASCTSDGRAAFESWVREHKAEYPNLVFAHDAAERTPERASRALYGVTGIPHQLVIDREGRIVAQVSGYRPGEVLLDAALAKAGIAVDPAILEKAAEDQRQRDAQSGPKKATVPALPLAPIRR
jgi:peroxiredoxin